MVTLRYLISRTIQTIILLLGLLTALFITFRLMPGDYASLLANSGAPPEAVEATRERWGLNEPLYIQYINYLKNFVTLDLGTSIYYGIPVWEFVSERIFNSAILLAPAVTVGYILGSILGSFMGINRDSLLDRWGVVPIVFLGSIPIFFLGLLFIIVFASGLNLFPTSGMVSPSTVRMYDTWWRPYLTIDFLKHATLPFISVALYIMYSPTLVMRTSAAEVSDSGFIDFHKKTGIGKARTTMHLGKIASLPVITIFPIDLAKAVSGLVLIETVFNWPGIGFALIEAVSKRDFPVIQFVFFSVAAFVIIGNFVVDIVYGYIDPRVSVEDEN